MRRHRPHEQQRVVPRSRLGHCDFHAGPEGRPPRRRFEGGRVVVLAYAITPLAHEREGVRVGDRVRDVPAGTLARIGNGLFEGSATRAAKSLILDFVSGLTDRYACSWPHVAGAVYCHDLFDNVRHDFAIKPDEGGKGVQLKYLNTWTSRYNAQPPLEHHFARQPTCLQTRKSVW